MSYIEKLVRFDSNHARRIEATYQDMPSSYVADQVKYFNLEVVTHYQPLASVMGVDTVDEYDIDDVENRHRAAVVCGEEFKFYVELYKHSGYAFQICQRRPKRTFDSGCAGAVYISRQSWQNAFPNIPFDFEKVYEELSRTFDEYVTATLNGEIFEAVVYDEKGDCDVCYCDHLSAEEALAAAQQDYPDIRYCDGDFIATTTYKLRSEI